MPDPPPTTLSDLIHSISGGKGTQKSTPLLNLIVTHYADRIGLFEYIDRLVPWDEKTWPASPGMLTMSIVHLFCLERWRTILLDEIPYQLGNNDFECLLGIPIDPEVLVPGVYEPLFDGLALTDPGVVFGTLAENVHAAFPDLTMRSPPANTTFHLIYEKYVIDDAGGGLTLHPVRHDNEEFVSHTVQTGIVADGSGLLYYADTIPPSISEEEWTANVLADLSTRANFRSPEVTVLADAALFLGRAQCNRIKTPLPMGFISRMPAKGCTPPSRAIVKQALDEGAWTTIGACCREPSGGAERLAYQSHELSTSMYGVPCRAIVYRPIGSTDKVHKRMEQQREVIAAYEEHFAQCLFDSPSSAAKEIKNFRRSVRTPYFTVKCEIIPEDTDYLVVISGIEPRKDRVENESKSGAPFVLITSAPTAGVDSREVLMRWKEGPNVKRMHTNLRRSCSLAPGFLKGNRIRGLMLVLHLSHLIKSALSAVAQARMHALGKPPYMSALIAPLQTPTYLQIYRGLSPFMVRYKEDSVEIRTRYPKDTASLPYLLQLLDVKE
ncbi:MAG: hypothetical protein NT074_02810 [Methanomicrobiales archaeon]|jgi:hypothetical protein|nr:hypothetical protein [Methanomicrobiales archaeon]